MGSETSKEANEWSDTKVDDFQTHDSHYNGPMKWDQYKHIVERSGSAPGVRIDNNILNTSKNKVGAAAKKSDSVDCTGFPCEKFTLSSKKKDSTIAIAITVIVGILFAAFMIYKFWTKPIKSDEEYKYENYTEEYSD